MAWKVLPASAKGVQGVKCAKDAQDARGAQDALEHVKGQTFAEGSKGLVCGTAAQALEWGGREIQRLRVQNA
eukprot:1144380-Pelagomonas_calceolata.AAC.8